MRQLPIPPRLVVDCGEEQLSGLYLVPPLVRQHLKFRRMCASNVPRSFRRCSKWSAASCSAESNASSAGLLAPGSPFTSAWRSSATPNDPPPRWCALVLHVLPPPLAAAAKPRCSAARRRPRPVGCRRRLTRRCITAPRMPLRPRPRPVGWRSPGRRRLERLRRSGCDGATPTAPCTHHARPRAPFPPWSGAAGSMARWAAWRSRPPSPLSVAPSPQPPAPPASRPPRPAPFLRGGCHPCPRGARGWWRTSRLRRSPALSWRAVPDRRRSRTHSPLAEAPMRPELSPLQPPKLLRQQ